MENIKKITDILTFDGVRIIWRNFTGEARKYNQAGDRNFTIVIPDVEMANQMLADGWNVKIKAPVEEGDDFFCTMEVKVKFNDKYPNLNPKIYLRSGRNFGPLDAESVFALDHMEILNVDLDIRPYNWGPIQGAYGVTAYVDGMCVTQKIDRFEAEYQASDEWRNLNQ